MHGHKFNGDHPRGGEGVPVLESTSLQCKWPLGAYQDKPTHYCGEVTENLMKSFCTHHQRMAYTRSMCR